MAGSPQKARVHLWAIEVEKLEGNGINRRNFKLLHQGRHRPIVGQAAGSEHALVQALICGAIGLSGALVGNEEE